MVQNLIADLKSRAGNALGLVSLAAVAGVALLAASGFLCAALFVAVMQNHGAVVACIAGAGLYLAISLAAAACYTYRKRMLAEHEAAAARARLATALNDPLMIVEGLQAMRSIKLKRLLPLLALAGVAAGLMMGQPADKGGDDN